MSDVIFEIKDLVKEYPALRALDNVNTTIKRGFLFAMFLYFSFVLLLFYRNHRDNLHPF